MKMERALERTHTCHAHARMHTTHICFFFIYYVKLEMRWLTQSTSSQADKMCVQRMRSDAMKNTVQTYRFVNPRFHNWAEF